MSMLFLFTQPLLVEAVWYRQNKGANVRRPTTVDLFEATAREAAFHRSVLRRQQQRPRLRHGLARSLLLSSQHRTVNSSLSGSGLEKNFPKKKEEEEKIFLHCCCDIVYYKMQLQFQQLQQHGVAQNKEDSTLFRAFFVLCGSGLYGLISGEEAATLYKSRGEGHNFI